MSFHIFKRAIFLGPRDRWAKLALPTLCLRMWVVALWPQVPSTLGVACWCCFGKSARTSFSMWPSVGAGLLAHPVCLSFYETTAVRLLIFLPHLQPSLGGGVPCLTSYLCLLHICLKDSLPREKTRISGACGLVDACIREDDLCLCGLDGLVF